MLELQNEHLARSWLNLTSSSRIEAAVYFNGHDELFVLSRSGTPSPFYSSPYSQQLDKCIISLDDGHTCGTDLKVPLGFQALVTLGPRVTKDKLLQGCMRMRQLGHRHTIMFAAPPEVDTQIRLAGSIPMTDNIVDAVDVLHWVTQATCGELQTHITAWAQQGVEYNQREEAQQLYNQTKDISNLKVGWMKPEACSLEELYGVLSPTPEPSISDFTVLAYNIPGFCERLALLGFNKLKDSRMNEELRQEVDHKMEQEHQIARLTREEPAGHQVHPDVKSFIQTGCMQPRSPGIKHLFQPLISMSQDPLNGWSRTLFASADFSCTLEPPPACLLNDYMHPVNWVVQGANGV